MNYSHAIIERNGAYTVEFADSIYDRAYPTRDQAIAFVRQQQERFALVDQIDEMIAHLENHETISPDQRDRWTQLLREITVS